MAAPGAGGAGALPPPPPAEDEPPGAPPGEAAAEGEEGGGSGAELLAVTEELVQSLAALEAGAGAASGTVLYLRAEGAGPSAGEQRRLLESPEPPSPPRPAAAPLAPAELRRVIEQVSKAQEQLKPAAAAAPPPQPCPAGGIMQNAARQLQSVAQQVALQQGRAAAAARLLPQKLLMQRPLPSHSSVSVDKIPLSKMVNGRRAACATASSSRSPNPIVAAGSSASTPSLEKRQKDDKLKKSLKVKTRSGRISRPPKYKAKDYKFIKMEDLAHGHQSDSDDYSELSIEDDEEGKVKGKDALFSSSNYNLKPKTFKCQTCEKSYIGKGGLARHYKLNPDHGELESSPQKIPLNKPNGSIFVEEEMMSPIHLDSIAVTLNHEKALATSLEETVDSKAGEQLIQQCDNEDLMELALPRLTKLVTVYEFLLMKVEKGYPAKAYFADVYREFEDLHNMVKKMAYDHLSNSDSVNCQQPVEVKDAKVAESLGITEILSGEQKIQGAGSYSQCVIKMVSEQVPVDILGQKRSAESSGEELLPPAKRTKIEDVTETVNNAYASQDEVKEKSGSLCTLFEKDGFNPLNGEILLSEDRHVTCCTTGTTLQPAEEHNSLADSGVRIDGENSGTFSQTVEMRIEYPQPVSTQGPGVAGEVSLLHTEVVLPVGAGGSAGPGQARFVSGSVAAPELRGSASEQVAARQSGGLPTNEENGHGQKYRELQEENPNFAIKECSEQVHNADMTDEIQELEKVFSTNVVPIKYPQSAQTQSHQNAVQGASLSAHGNQENAFKNESEYPCGTQEAQELANAVTVDETVAFEISDESHDFLSQGHEQIFIQTSDGLILSHPDTAVLSQAEGIVIVTDSNGTTMHIRTSEGIPLETVEALLAMEAGGQSEDILLSQSELEP
ncbi:hypothetical protein DUI87_24932 [Hirundo rustica rustica]|uniref:C2H2-type domain-containing protein n=1 Tax=Hirundo rustica rustica TaxID=333673 RepID=A0A3M0JI75_HIRRU|nr:hypothetical protein DUI87_24932 [Hirundo rustica rustica]